MVCGHSDKLEVRDDRHASGEPRSSSGALPGEGLISVVLPLTFQSASILSHVDLDDVGSLRDREYAPCPRSRDPISKRALGTVVLHEGVRR